MPARAPGERPKEGETIQEHDLEHRRERRDQQASDQGQQPKTKPKAPTKRETWADWMPEGAPMPDLLSHEELLEELHRSNVAISPYTLEHYRRNGIIPRPIRRQHNGAVRPVYPLWYVQAIKRIKEWQAQGKSLDEIRDAIQPVLKMWALSTVRWKDPIADLHPPLDIALKAYAQEYARRAGGPSINMVRVTLFDDEDNVIDYHDTGPD